MTSAETSDAISLAYQGMLIRSDLIQYSFSLRSSTFSAKEASDLVGWLAQEFTLGRCNWFASAISSMIGRENHIGFFHPDGHLLHAVVATAPQYGGELRGHGCDILGRRTLSRIASEMAEINPAFTMEIGDRIADPEFGQGEMEALIDLAGELPWTAHLVGRSPSAPDGHRLLDISCRLGMPAVTAVPQHSL